MDLGAALVEFGSVKVAAGILGIISLSTGSICFFGSEWMRKNLHYQCLHCILETSRNRKTLSATTTDQYLNGNVCPNILFEAFHIAVLIAGFVISSIIALVASFRPKLQNKTYFQLLDCLFHFFIGFLTIVTSCLFIYSAGKIGDLLENPFWKDCERGYGVLPHRYLTGGKIFAGVIALKVGILYELVAYSAWQRARDDPSPYLLTH